MHSGYFDQAEEVDDLIMLHVACFISYVKSLSYILQIATVEVPEEHMGAVVELLGKRRGQMFNMENVGYVIASVMLS